MAKQLTYASEHVDAIQPRNEQERRVLDLSVKHGLITPMAWDTPPTHFGLNRPTWAELCAFAAEIADGVAIPAPTGFIPELDMQGKPFADGVALPDGGVTDAG